MTLSSLGTSPKSYRLSQESAPRISSFYNNEYQTLTFGEYSGRPSDFIDFHKSDLVYFLSDGWKIDSVLASGEGGKWTVEARSVSAQTGKSAQTSSGTTTGSGVSGDTGESAGSTSSSTTSSSGSGSTSGAGATANTQEGGPYWFAWSKIRLVRKRLQGDRVTDYLMERLTASYNEGRQLNSDRYDEICRVLASMLSSTQGMVNGSDVGAGLADGLYYVEQTLVDRMRAIALPSVEEVEDVTARVDARVAQWLAAREADINRQFDAKIEQAKSQMVSNGTYNSVVWPSVSAGLERERQNALNNLSSALGELETSVAQIKGSAFTQKMQRVELAQKIEADIADMRAKLKESRAKIISEVTANKVNLTELRNKAAQALAAFMENREDEFPDLETILEVVTRLDNQSVDPGGGLQGGASGHNTQTKLPDPTLPPMPDVALPR